MLDNYYLGLFFSFLHAIVFIYSLFKKDKKDMIKLQIIGPILLAISNFFLYAYSAVVTSVINATRNYLTYKDKLSKTITIICILFYIIFGLAINNRGWIGIFPIMSACTYTIFCFKSTNAQTLRLGLIINQSMLLVHDTYVRAYPSIITEIFAIIFAIYNIIKFNKQKNK